MQGPRTVIKHFQEDPEVKVFLLTRGQGAAGLTLTQGALRTHIPRLQNSQHPLSADALLTNRKQCL